MILKLPNIKLLGFLSSLAFVSILNANISEKLITDTDYKELLTKITPLEGTTPAQWRVTWIGNTSNTATISWSTAENGSKHIVHFGESAHNRNGKAYEYHVESSNNGLYAIPKRERKNTNPAYYHHSVLKNLKPNTKYYFTIESDGNFSRQLHFITAPHSGNFKMLHGGDSRSGLLNRCRMNLRMAKLLEQQPDIVALCHGGDYIGSGKSWRHWRTWLSHHELTTLPSGRVIPVIPTLGNHDSGEIYFQVFNIKNPKRKGHCWHTTNITKDVNIITLDTNYSAKGAQENWLHKQLKELRPKSNWLLTNYHRPLFPAVKSPAKQAAVFVPLFEKFNVDLACESDGHNIKRTVPIRNGKKDVTGVTYIGEGGLGVGQRHPNGKQWYLQGGLVNRGSHVMLLDFQKKTLTIKTILLNGSTLDTFSLKSKNLKK